MSRSRALLFSSRERRILGLMSGTSLDGIDVADVYISGTGKSLVWRLAGFRSFPYPAEVREVIFRNSRPETSSVAEIALLGDLLASEYEYAIRSALEDWGSAINDYEAVGLHGQTLYHQPVPVQLGGRRVTGTLQVGDPSILATRLELPVVGDFRVADMALGGQGAPLVPYFDYVTFRDKNENRLLVNLGGIANVTVLPAASDLASVSAFDTGPGNMILDALAIQFLDAEFDDGGRTSEVGTPNAILLDELLGHPFFSRKPPRSTGRELFSPEYVDHLIERARSLRLSNEDLFATAAALTADSLLVAWRKFVETERSIDRVLVAGGGIHNRAVMNRLKSGFNPVPVQTTKDYGLDPDAKEAVCFAVLAHETLNGVATNLPDVTGASRPTVLGKICLPE